MGVIELFNVSKTYGKTVALKNLSLSINEKEIYGLLGPNGAGKTTTLKIIVGLLTPDTGTVRIMGFDVSKSRVDALKYVGYVPEDPYLFQNLTVREFIEFIGRLRGMQKDELRDRVEYYLSIFELDEKESTIIRALSRGMIQKVAIASALIHNPRILIMDEPMVNIDPEAQYVFKKEVKNLVEKGSTALISSHMLDMVERFCTRVGIINKGTLLIEGEIDELKRIAFRGEDATLEEVFMKIIKGEE